MFNGSLIEDLFAVVSKAEKSARPALPEETQSREIDAEPLSDFDGRREANSEAE